MIGIISGTAFVSLGAGGEDGACEPIPVETPYGPVVLLRTKLGGKTVYFLQRHLQKYEAGSMKSEVLATGRSSSGKSADFHDAGLPKTADALTTHLCVPPHLVNYRANIWALKAAKVDKIISVSAVGSLKREIAPGNYVVVDDFIDFTKARQSTFFETEKVHTDVSEPYDPKIRKALLSACKKIGAKAHDGGVYVCTEGPRFETKAEIRMMAQFGDVVGMTGVPEVVLANELKIPYANLCFSANYACGIAKGIMDEVKIEKLCADRAKEITAILENAVKILG